MSAADNLFGIMGLTPGGLGIWVLVFGLAAWWVRGMADRRRAANEGVGVESAATKVLFDQLQAEIERLTKRIEKQDERIAALEIEVHEERIARAKAEAEILRLNAFNAVQGEVRQRAAQVVAAERIEGREK